MDGPLSILVLTFIKLTTVPDETIPLNIGWHYYEDKYIFYADALRCTSTRLSRKFPKFVSPHCWQWATRQLGKDDTQTQTFNKTQIVIVSNIYPSPTHTHTVPQKKVACRKFSLFIIVFIFFFKYLKLHVIFNPLPQSIMYCRVIIRSCTLSCRTPALCALCLDTVPNITHSFIDWS